MPTTVPAPPVPATVLIVEDDPGIAELERDRLEEAGYRAVLAASADAALAEVGRGEVDLVLLDYRLPGGMDGLEFYSRVKAAGYDLPVILVTGFGNEATVIQALRVGVRDFVTKSLEYLDYLPEAVARVLRQVGTERQLAESEARLAGVIESAKDAVIVVEADRRVSLFNPAAERMFGCPAAAARGRPLAAFIPNDVTHPGGPTDAPDAGSFTHRLRMGSHGVRAGGDVFPLEATVAPGRTRGRKFYTVVVRDVTERQKAEETLRRSEALLRRAEGMAHVAGWTFEVADGVYVTSEEGGRICGHGSGPHGPDELAGNVHPDDLPRVQAAIAGALAGTPFELEHRLVVGGRLKWVTVRGEPEADAAGRVVRIIGVTQDVTARRQLEEQFRQAQKMEAFGQLASGVAHDFNNLLTVINGYGEVLLESLPADDPNRAAVQAIRGAGEQAAGLTGQLLAFCRRAVLEPRVVDPNAVVADSAKLLGRLIGENIALTTALDPAARRVRVDPGRLGQVLMNLAVNARDAMPDGGRLTVETKDTQLADGDPNRPHGVTPGRYVQLVVTDTGTGMSDEVKARIFEPFFTTKGVGKGTGLGLATVYGIVTASGGQIAVDSVPGAGSTFRVYLPAAEGPDVAPEPTPVPQRKGAETVLVVEDQEEVRKLAVLSLQRYGYQVLSAGSGEEALHLATGRPPVDLLVTDLVMPGMSGWQLAASMKESYLGLRVLFLSGYTDDSVFRGEQPEDRVSFLQKPFTPAVLAGRVRAVLDGQEG